MQPPTPPDDGANTRNGRGAPPGPPVDRRKSACSPSCGGLSEDGSAVARNAEADGPPLHGRRSREPPSRYQGGSEHCAGWAGNRVAISSTGRRTRMPCRDREGDRADPVAVSDRVRARAWPGSATATPRPCSPARPGGPSRRRRGCPASRAIRSRPINGLDRRLLRLPSSTRSGVGYRPNCSTVAGGEPGSKWPTPCSSGIRPVAELGHRVEDDLPAMVADVRRIAQDERHQRPGDARMCRDIRLRHPPSHGPDGRAGHSRKIRGASTNRRSRRAEPGRASSRTPTEFTCRSTNGNRSSAAGDHPAGEVPPRDACRPGQGWARCSCRPSVARRYPRLTTACTCIRMYSSLYA
jgi:hypothetical protein